MIRGLLQRLAYVSNRATLKPNAWETQGTRAPPPTMSEEEKAQRREAALKAAESRTKDWDRRINKGRQATQAKSATKDVSGILVSRCLCQVVRCFMRIVGFKEKYERI